MRRLLFVLAAMAAMTVPGISQSRTPLSCSLVTTGNFAQGPIDFYTIDALPNDAISIRVLVNSTDPAYFPPFDGGGRDGRFSLFDSSNRQVAPRQLAVRVGATLAFEFDLPTGGQYTLNLVNRGTSTAGSYQVVYTTLNRPCSSTVNLSCGVGRQDQITGPLQIKTYQFQAKATDILSLRFNRLAPFTSIAATPTTAGVSFTPIVSVYTSSGQPLTLPNGTIVAEQFGSVPLDFPVPNDGPLTLIVFDAADVTGNYALSITKINGPCTGKVLTCGSVSSSSIDAPLSLDSYGVQATAGDIISIRSAAISGSAIPVVELYDPTGLPVTANRSSVTSNGVISITLTTAKSGVYTANVRDGATLFATGKYSITLLRLNRPCGASQNVTCGSIVDGSVSSILGTSIYTLNASANDKFLLRLLKNTGSMRPRIDVYDSQGNAVTSVLSTDLARQTFTASTSGTYTLIAGDGLDGTQTGSYTFSLLRLNGPCNSTPLSCGGVQPATLGRPLAYGVYTYAAAAGEAFSVRVIDAGGSLQEALEIYDPQGNAAGQPITGTFTGLDVTQAIAGTYTIVATDSNKHPTGGSFAIDLLRTVGACGVRAPQGQTLRGIVSGAAPFISYTIPASAGDSLLVRSASFTSGFNPQMELYDPSGSRIDSQTFALARTAASSGNYTVIVSAAALGSGGAYSLASQLLNSPAGTVPLQCGGSTGASLSATNEFRFYTATASAGDLARLLLTKTSDNFSPQMDLYDLSGARLSTGLDISQKVSQDGDYLVVVSPSSSNGETGSYTLAYQRPNNPCSPVALTCGQSTLRQVTIPGQFDTFTFTGSGGDRMNIRLPQRSGAYAPFAELYDSNGTRLASSGSGAVIASLPASGTFTLLVRDTRGTSLGSYRVTLQNDSNACKVTDAEAPTISLLQPTGGEVLGGGLSYLIQWQSDDNVGVTAHDIALSLDGGKTFAAPVAASLSGTAQSFTWQVPADIAPSRTAILRVTATDGAGNAQSAASGPLTVIGAGFTPNSTTNIVYDSLNRISQVTLSDGRILTYTWDAAGNLLGVTVSH